MMQVYLDVDCTNITYSSPVSPVVSDTINRWGKNICFNMMQVGETEQRKDKKAAGYNIESLAEGVHVCAQQCL